MINSDKNTSLFVNMIFKMCGEQYYSVHPNLLRKKFHLGKMWLIFLTAREEGRDFEKTDRFAKAGFKGNAAKETRENEPVPSSSRANTED